jgi:UDP-N-acetylmuramoylalanine--D-glutamate ligase
MSFLGISAHRVGVWGLGREGIAVASALAAAGHAVVAADEAAIDRPGGLPESVAVHTGPGALDALLGAELVLASPGVPRVHPFRAELAARGVAVSTPTAVWMREHWRDVIGVTGTKGKSTTSTLIHLLLRSAGRDAELAGNIGRPLVDITEPDALVVAELSSYQCAYLDQSPAIAVVTSLYEDHLTWHGSRDAYRRDKARVFSEGATVLACDDRTLTELRALCVPIPAERIAPVDSLDGIELSLNLQLPHNRDNVRLAIAVATHVVGDALTNAAINDVTATFGGLRYRLEVVSTARGRTWITDCLSTTTESTVAALRAFADSDVVLIVGGLDRGVDYGPLNDELLAMRSVRVVAMPDNGEAMVAPFAAAHPDRVRSADTMEDAVAAALELGTEGSVVLLSPAAPSHNRYRDYAAKSEHFEAVVTALA